jgi:hypothetical protein
MSTSASPIALIASFTFFSDAKTAIILPSFDMLFVQRAHTTINLFVGVVKTENARHARGDILADAVV